LGSASAATEGRDEKASATGGGNYFRNEEEEVVVVVWGLCVVGSLHLDALKHEP